MSTAKPPPRAAPPPLVETVWHVVRNNRLVVVPPAADGLDRSTVFSGLWLDPAALLAGDRAALRAALDRGLATAEHAASVTQLAAARGGSSSCPPLRVRWP